MKCPACGSEQTAVRETRRAGDDLHRRRVCRACPAQWWTAEVVLSEVGTRPAEPAWWTEARSLRRKGLSGPEIAEAVGMSLFAVQRALRPKLRKHVLNYQRQYLSDPAFREARTTKRRMKRENAPQS